MAERISQQDLARIATITDAPPLTRVDRNFGLPGGLYVATVASYLGFLAVLGTAFMNPGLALPMTIFALFIVAAFGVPALWVRMKPEALGKPLTFDQFRHRGIQTETGPLTFTQASVQVLILPVLILMWGVSIAVIVALT